MGDELLELPLPVEEAEALQLFLRFCRANISPENAEHLQTSVDIIFI